MTDLNSLPEWLSWMWLAIFAATLAAAVVLVAAVTRRVWRWWRGRVVSHKNYLFGMSEPMIDKHSVCVWRGDFFTGFTDASGDARAGDLQIDSGPAEPPPVVDGAAGRPFCANPGEDLLGARPNAPYGSKPPVNHTVERVDDLERRVAGLEGAEADLYPIQTRFLRDFMSGNLRFRHSGKPLKAEATPDDGIPRVWDLRYYYNDQRVPWTWVWDGETMHFSGDNEKWQLAYYQTIGDLEEAWGMTTGFVELHGAERDAVIADWLSRND